MTIPEAEQERPISVQVKTESSIPQTPVRKRIAMLGAGACGVGGMCCDTQQCGTQHR